MIGRNTFNLLFHVHKGRKDSAGMVPDYLRCTVNGKSSTISIILNIILMHPGCFYNAITISLRVYRYFTSQPTML
jgi:hypothetical protein